MFDIYIAGELTRCSDSEKRKEFYEAIAEICKRAGFSVYLPHQHTDPVAHPNVSPKEVYRKDFDIVAKARMIIAYVGEPSLGVGTELEIAKNNDTDIILHHFNSDKVSRMALGNSGVKKIITYDSEDECLEKLRGFLQNK
jgi:hypothetical protein